MALKDMATTARGFSITPVPPGAWVPGSPNYTQIPEPKVKAVGASVLKDQISWSFPPGPGTCVLPPPFPANNFNGGGGSMIATAAKVKVGNVATAQDKPPMRKDDQGLCSGSFTAPGPGITFPCSCVVKISNAGQSKAKAE